MDIRGRVALVTGANRGLGKAFVIALIKAGASKVYACARDVSSLDVPGSHPVELDITDASSVTRSAHYCSDVDVLINNAGVVTDQSMLSPEAVSSAWNHFETNALGTLMMVKAYAPILAQRGGGAIINILSVQSWITAKSKGAYSASKAAQWSLTNGLRNELRHQNTIVIGVHPSFIDTESSSKVEAEKASPKAVAEIALYALSEERSEIMVDDTGRWIKYSLSDPDAVYLKSMALLK